jgi:coatomer protein complex subunit gamma
MLQGIERLFKQAIVDKSTTVASGALVSAYHLFHDNKDVVRRWVNEVQEALNSSSPSVQYHAIGLMYLIRQHDKMAVAKFVTHFSRAPLRSPYAYVMIIRYAVKVMEEEQDERYHHLIVYLLAILFTCKIVKN